MSNILTVGIATLDIINKVDCYPHEDDEIRAISQEQRRGGNATNTAVVLSQLGHQCFWAGTLADEADSRLISDDLYANSIDMGYSLILDRGKVPTSYITLNNTNGSRTIVHYRDLPEYPFNCFQKINLDNFDWIHFEGRNIHETLKMLEWTKQTQSAIPISIELEKSRPGIEELIPFADLVLFSEHYVSQPSGLTAERFIHNIGSCFPDKIFICALGEQGAKASYNNEIIHQAACKPDRIIDTLGAGDTFNAAIIHQQLRKATLEQTLAFACQLAGKKCARKGIGNLIKRL